MSKEEFEALDPNSPKAKAMRKNAEEAGKKGYLAKVKERKTKKRRLIQKGGVNTKTGEFKPEETLKVKGGFKTRIRARFFRDKTEEE
jgi:hypothetical protein